MLFAGGLILGFLCIGLPIWQANNGGSNVSISFMGAAVSVILLCLSPGYIIGGRRFVEFIWPPEDQKTLVGTITICATFLVGIGVFFGLRAYLASLGYSF